MFLNRTEAGRQLAERLTQHARRPDALVLGISRGGIAVAHEVARRLKVPLDVFLVRRLLVPDHRLMSLGAVASGGAAVLDEVVIEDAGLSREAVNAIVRRERDELRRQEMFYRDDREPLQLRGRTAILVDDGIASGETLLSAIACMRRREPARIVAAAPVGSRKAVHKLGTEADEVICLETPETYHGVGQWYEDFRPVSAEKAHELLSQFSEVS